jgi:RNA polymerase sigma-70 factor (ECF subfamily)
MASGEDAKQWSLLDVSITERPSAGHPLQVTASTLLEALGRERAERTAELAASPLAAAPRVGLAAAALTSSRPMPTFAEIYEGHFDFVWRSARRLGVAEAHVDDAVQEIFMVVHRRAADFEGRSSLKTWLFGITRHVARNHHRALRRKPVELLGERDPASGPGDDPEQRCVALEGQALLHALLDELDDDKREVFVLAELEQMPGPEIARAIDVNLNTMHARLRAARRDFEAALSRYRARSARGRAP